jgi:predicted transcriptional regulator
MTNQMADVTPEDDLGMLGEECTYDPLAETDERDADERAETFGYRASAEEARREQEAPDDGDRVAPAAERIERLLEDMAPFRSWLLAILRACREPQGGERVKGLVAELQRRQQSVYGAESLCAMLVQAGALRKLTSDGEPYEEVAPELVEVEQGGRRYLRPTEPPAAVWQTTPEGAAALEEHDPLSTLLRVVDDRKKYMSVYLEILEMCEGDGASIGEVRRQVNTNPALGYPRKSAQLFMDDLERNDAIEWEGAWKTTEVGQRLLEALLP